MNEFKQALAARIPQIGLWQALASSYTVEICAGAGFDWLLIDGEHAPNDLPLVLAQLQASASYPVESIVRLPTDDVVLVKQYLDIGARTLLFPTIESSEQARRLVSAMRYPPQGFRGVGAALARASRWNRKPDYLQRANGEACLLLQIETLRGMENVADIAAVEGVDGIFIGPSDLAATLGHIGNPTHPNVQAAIVTLVEAIHRQGVPSGILATDPASARRYLDMGITFVAVGTDVSILARGAEALARQFVKDPKGTVASTENSGY